jgi:hypothetical protein
MAHLRYWFCCFAYINFQEATFKRQTGPRHSFAYHPAMICVITMTIPSRSAKKLDTQEHF